MIGFNEHWIVILVIIFLSGIIKGSTGFGFALFSFPLLAHYIPVKSLIPVLTLFNLFSSSLMVMQGKPIKINRRILLLSVTGVIGVVIGSLFILFVPNNWLKLFVSVILIFLAGLFLAGYRFKIRKIRRGISLAGLTSGFLGGSTSISGPPLALFLTSAHLDSAHFRLTFSWFSVFTAVVAILDYIKIGIVHSSTFLVFAVSLPVLILSTIVGKRINGWLPQKAFFHAVIILTLLAGAFLFFDTLKNII